MINWQRVAELKEDVGAEDMAGVVAIFISEVDDVINGLVGLQNSDSKDVEAVMHFLKGCAYNLGFQAFGDYCGQSEAQARSGDVSGISFSKVTDLYEASKSSFFAEFPGS